MVRASGMITGTRGGGVPLLQTLDAGAMRWCHCKYPKAKQYKINKYDMQSGCMKGKYNMKRGNKQ